MGDTIATIIVALVAWIVYLLPGVILSLPIWYWGRRRARFMWWELGVFILPFIIWLCFFLIAKDKSPGNLWEAFILGGAVPVAALIRIIIGTNLNRHVVAGCVVFLICVFAALLGTMFPEVPFHWFH